MKTKEQFLIENPDALNAEITIRECMEDWEEDWSVVMERHYQSSREFPYECTCGY